MFDFNDYEVSVKARPKDYYSKVPEERYVAYLREIAIEELRATGSDRETALKNLETEFHDYQQFLLEQGKTLPPPNNENETEYSGKLLLRLPKTLHQRLAEYSKEQGMSLNSVLLMCVTSFLASESTQAINHQDLVVKLDKLQDILCCHIDQAIEYSGYSERTLERKISTQKTIASEEVSNEGYDTKFFKLKAS